MTESKIQEAALLNTGVELGVQTSTTVKWMNLPTRLNKQTNEYTCRSIKQVNKGVSPETRLWRFLP